MDNMDTMEYTFNKHFTQTPNMVLRNNRISLQAKALYSIIASYDYGTNNSDCFPSLSTLEKVSGVSRHSIIKYIKELESCGFLSVSRKVNTSNHYKVIVPKDLFKEFYDVVVQDMHHGSAEYTLPLVQNVHPNKTNINNTNLKNMSDTDLDIAAANSAASPAETSSAIGNYVEATLKDKHTTLVSIDRANNVPANKYSIQDEESNVGRKAFALQPTIANSAKMIKKVTRKTIDDFPLTNTASSGTNNDVTATIPKIAGVRLDRNLSAAYRRLQDVIGGKTKPKSNDFNLQWLLFTEKYFKNQFGQLFGKSKEAMLANKLIAQYDYEDIIKMLDYVFKNWERLSKDKYSYYNSKIPQVQIIYNDRANLMSAAQQEEKELF